MWGMEIGKRLAEKRMRNTADLRKDVQFILEWYLPYVVGRRANNNNNNNNNCRHIRLLK